MKKVKIKENRSFTKRVLRKIFAFANLLLLCTVIASVLSFYFSYYAGFNSVEQIRVATEKQFADTIVLDIEDHIGKATSLVHLTEMAILQGSFSNLRGIESLIEFQHHAWQVFDMGYNMGYGLSSYFLVDELSNLVGYAADPLCALVQFAGLPFPELFYMIPILDKVGTFNTTHISDVALNGYTVNASTWEPYTSTKASHRASWSDLYIFAGAPGVVFLTFSYPVFFPNNSFCCVIFADFTVSKFSDFLSKIPAITDAGGFAMLLDTDGYLIASSDVNQIPLKYNPVLDAGEKMKGSEVEQPELAAGSRYLEKRYPNGYNFTSVSAEINTEKGPYFFHATQVHIAISNTTWILITMQLRSYYFSQIDKMQLLIIIFSCISLGTGVAYRMFPIARRWWRRREHFSTGLCLHMWITEAESYRIPKDREKERKEEEEEERREKEEKEKEAKAKEEGEKGKQVIQVKAEDTEGEGRGISVELRVTKEETEEGTEESISHPFSVNSD